MRSDTELLDALQELTKGYGMGWLLRNSSYGLGMRLHETTADGALPDVREAIEKYLNSIQ